MTIAGVVDEHNNFKNFFEQVFPISLIDFRHQINQKFFSRLKQSFWTLTI